MIKNKAISRLDFAVQKKLLPKSKRSQQETVGFVLIIIIVTVIIVGFLWFMLTSAKSDVQTSAEVSNLLQSSMYYTTECAVDYLPNYKNTQDLIKACYNMPNENCLDGRTVCESLNNTLKKIIGESLSVNEASPNKAYKIKIHYHSLGKDVPDNVFLTTEEGRFANCSARYGGTSSFKSGSGIVEIKLELCRG